MTKEDCSTVILSIVISLLTSLATVSFYAGKYITEIKHNSDDIKQLKSQQRDLSKSVHFILGRIDVKNIKASAYQEAASSKGESLEAIADDLYTIDQLDRSQAKVYMLQKGFSEQQVQQIIKPPE